MNNLLKGKEDEIDGAPLNNNRVLTALPELECKIEILTIIFLISIFYNTF